MVLPDHVDMFATRALPRFKSSISSHFEHICWPGSVVGIANGYWLGDPGIECRWGEIFRFFPDRYWGPSGLLYNGYRNFPGSKELQGRNADPFWCRGQERVYLFLYPRMGHTACTEPQHMYKGVIYEISITLFKIVRAFRIKQNVHKSV